MLLARHCPSKPHVIPILRAMTSHDLSKLEEVVQFWDGVDRKKKFTKDPNFDALLTDKYAGLHGELMAGTYDIALDTYPMPAVLGAVLVLDQLSRNMFRGSALSFASDPKALALAKGSISKGHHEEAGENKVWFFMPFMHSEDLADQTACVEYFTSTSWVSAIHLYTGLLLIEHTLTLFVNLLC